MFLRRASKGARMDWNDSNEWLETDSLGGFASGTVGGIRTRRYHGLLLVATRPPAGRVAILVVSVQSVRGRSSPFASVPVQQTVSPGRARPVEELLIFGVLFFTLGALGHGAMAATVDREPEDGRGQDP